MPHSWEIAQQRSQSCLIAILLAPPLMVSIDWALSFNNIAKPPIYDIMRISGVPFDVGRTQAAYECLNRGHEWLFQIDADILAPPDTLMRLLNHRLPIVSALYHQKFPTWTGMDVRYMPCAFAEGRDAQGNPTRVEVTFQYGQIVEATFVPMGACLIHRSVFERFLAAGIKRFFQWTLTADNPSGLSEDFFMTRTARDLGIKSYVDTGIQVIHEAQAKVDVRGISPKI